MFSLTVHFFFFFGKTTICQAAFENITKVFVASLTSFSVLKKIFQKFKSTIIITTELLTKKKKIVSTPKSKQLEMKDSKIVHNKSIVAHQLIVKFTNSRGNYFYNYSCISFHIIFFYITI